MTVKQKRPFIEEIFARHLINGIVTANDSRFSNVNKIGYFLRPDVQSDELLNICTGFLANLAIAYSSPSNQKFLNLYLGE